MKALDSALAVLILAFLAIRYLCRAAGNASPDLMEQLEQDDLDDYVRLMMMDEDHAPDEEP